MNSSIRSEDDWLAEIARAYWQHLCEYEGFREAWGKSLLELSKQVSEEDQARYWKELPEDRRTKYAGLIWQSLLDRYPLPRRSGLQGYWLEPEEVLWADFQAGVTEPTPRYIQYVLPFPPQYNRHHPEADPDLIVPPGLLPFRWDPVMDGWNELEKRIKEICTEVEASIRAQARALEEQARRAGWIRRPRTKNPQMWGYALYLRLVKRLTWEQVAKELQNRFSDEEPVETNAVRLAVTKYARKLGLPSNPTGETLDPLP